MKREKIALMCLAMILAGSVNIIALPANALNVALAVRSRGERMNSGDIKENRESNKDRDNGGAHSGRANDSDDSARERKLMRNGLCVCQYDLNSTLEGVDGYHFNFNFTS